jgi:hypothetical protein
MVLTDEDCLAILELCLGPVSLWALERCFPWALENVPGEHGITTQSPVSSQTVGKNLKLLFLLFPLHSAHLGVQ